MLKKRVVAAVAAALMAGGASAVGVNPGGKGEQLIAPMVMVGGGWESEIRLVNTDTVNSAVVKLTFHERLHSEEVLDFLVFLSPGDVWRGTAVAQPHATAGMNRLAISSSDDSSLYVPNEQNNCPRATAQSVGFDPSLVRAAENRQPTSALTGAMDSSFTYLTVHESSLVTGLGNAPVDKAAILAAYSRWCNAAATGSAVAPAGTGAAGAVGTIGGTPAIVPLHAWNTPGGGNAITGDVTLRNPAAGGSLANLPMVALDSVDSAIYHRVGIYSSLGDTTAQLQRVGTATTNSDTKSSVEDALWANNFTVPYNLNGAATLATITFPTKDAWNRSAFSTGQYFPRIGNQPSVMVTARDEQERTLASVGCFISPCPVGSVDRLPWELNILTFTTGPGTTANGQVSTSGFTRGWVNVNVEQQGSVARAEANYNNFGRQGAPALSTYMIVEPRSTGGFNMTWAYAPKSQNPGAN
ncbi:MAG: hypothetical protein RLZZ612_1730 [Pseudomonadota bacterium]